MTARSHLLRWLTACTAFSRPAVETDHTVWSSQIVAVLDTATLFPASLRDTLLLSVEHDLFLPRWSTKTLDELARNLIRTGRMTQAKTERLLRTLINAFPGATIEPSPELLASLTNHPKDRHVLAAAIVSHSDFIVTPNLRDFGDQDLLPFNVRAVSPDDFLVWLLDDSSEILHQVIDLQWRALRHPPLSRNAVLDSLAVIAPKFAETMRMEAE